MKKKIPKISKKLQCFLTDESGKITKKDALGISMTTFLGVNIAEAGTTHSSTTHGNGNGKGGGTGHSSFGHGNTQSCSPPVHTSSLGKHASQIGGNTTTQPSHTSNFTNGTKSGHGNASGHSSHGSHGSHGSTFIGSCFTFEQRVLTNQGYKAIGTIKVGDDVISYDEKTNKYTTSTVAKLLIHDGYNDFYHDYTKFPLLKVIIQNDNNKIVSIQSTANHPFYNLSKKSYQRLREFNIGDEVLYFQGKGKIISLDILLEGNSLDGTIPVVYNIHMQDNHNHNYFVEGVLVHNAELRESKN